jgi:polar amino acid transport system substrate-binding protein
MKIKTLHSLYGIFLCCLLAASCKNEPKVSKPIFEFCTIESDMPFSASVRDTQTKMRGFYVDLGETLATELGMNPKPAYVMASFNARPIREGLLAGRCTAQIGLPRTKGKWLIPNKVQLTNPFSEMGYALVLPQNSTVAKAEDLRGKTVIVASGSPAHEGLNLIGAVKYVYAFFPEKAMELMAEGKADAAFVWGPTAGYQNKYLYKNRFKVIPTSYIWSVAIGFTAKGDSLANRTESALQKLKPEIQKLYDLYGFPTGTVMQMPELPFTKEQAE